MENQLKLFDNEKGDISIEVNGEIVGVIKSKFPAEFFEAFFPTDSEEEEKVSETMIEKVKEFHKAFNLPIRNHPEIVPLDEYHHRMFFLHEEILELNHAHYSKDIEGVADGIVDCLYILIGTSVQFGFADILPLLFEEVHKSNMSKLDENGKPNLRADGKVIKGKLYFKPNLKAILNEHLPDSQ